MFFLFTLFVAAIPALIASVALLVLCCIAPGAHRPGPDPSLPDPDPGYVDRGLAELQAFLQQASGQRPKD